MAKDKQSRGQQRPGGPPAADAAGPDDLGPKKGKGAPGAGGDEEARTCCGCRFPLLLALLQLALGVAVTVVGFLMAGVSSSLLVRDTPFWAGILVSIQSAVPSARVRTTNPAACARPRPAPPLTRAAPRGDARRPGPAAPRDRGPRRASPPPASVLCTPPAGPRRGGQSTAAAP